MLSEREGRALNPVREVEEGGSWVDQVEVNGGGGTTRGAREGRRAPAVKETKGLSGEPVSEVIEVKSSIADSNRKLVRGLPVRGVGVEVPEVKGGAVEIELGQGLELSRGLGVRNGEVNSDEADGFGGHLKVDDHEIG